MKNVLQIVMMVVIAIVLALVIISLVRSIVGYKSQGVEQGSEISDTDPTSPDLDTDPTNPDLDTDPTNPDLDDLPLSEEALMESWRVIESKQMSGLQKYGNYQSLHTPYDLENIMNLSIVPTFSGLIEGVEVLYSGVLYDNPNMAVFITDIAAVDLYEIYFEALRRCGFRDLKVARYYGYMCLGDEYSVYMRTSDVTIELESDLLPLGNQTIVLVTGSVASDILDKTRAFTGYDIGVYDEVRVIVHE